MAKLTQDELNQLKQMSILDVAANLGVELKKVGSYLYEWTEHDSFKIDTRKNSFQWYSRGVGGSTLDLVMPLLEKRPII